MAPIGDQPVPRRVGIRAFMNLAARWGLEKSALPVLLGCSSPNTIRAWIKASERDDDRDAPLDPDVQERLSHLISIYDGLHRLFSDDKYADAWVRTENRAFGGETPLSRMLRGQFADLYDVRMYVERALAA